MLKDSFSSVAVYVKLIVTVFLWGATYHVAKIALLESDAISLGYIRFILSSVILLVYCVCLHRKAFCKKTLYQWYILMLAGLFGAFLYNVFFLWAELLISPNYVAILYSFTPCMTLILSYIFLKQRLFALDVVGIICAFCGTFFTISLSDISCGKWLCSHMLLDISNGHLLALLAALCTAVFNLINRKAIEIGIDSVELITFSSIFAAIFFIIMVAVKNFWYHYDYVQDMINMFTGKSWQFWLSALYIAAISTCLGYVWYSEAISKLGVIKATVFQNGTAFSTLIVGMIFFNDSVSFDIFISGMIIVIGAYITNMHRSAR